MIQLKQQPVKSYGANSGILLTERLLSFLRHSSYWWRFVGYLRGTDLPSNGWNERRWRFCRQYCFDYLLDFERRKLAGMTIERGTLELQVLIRLGTTQFIMHCSGRHGLDSHLRITALPDTEIAPSIESLQRRRTTR